MEETGNRVPKDGGLVAHRGESDEIVPEEVALVGDAEHHSWDSASGRAARVKAAAVDGVLDLAQPGADGGVQSRERAAPPRREVGRQHRYSRPHIDVAAEWSVAGQRGTDLVNRRWGIGSRQQPAIDGDAGR